MDQEDKNRYEITILSFFFIQTILIGILNTMEDIEISNRIIESSYNLNENITKDIANWN